MKHYARKGTWVLVGAGTFSTQCGIDAPQSDMQNFPHYEDFLQVNAGFADICPACMASMFKGEKQEVIDYCVVFRYRNNKKTRAIVEKIWDRCTKNEAK